MDRAVWERGAGSERALPRAVRPALRDDSSVDSKTMAPGRPGCLNPGPSGALLFQLLPNSGSLDEPQE